MNSTNQIPIKEVVQNGIIYSIKEDAKQAYVSGFAKGADKIIIPAYIEDNLQNYVVTRILKCAFKNIKIESIQFAPDSKIQVIEEEAFTYAKIKTITIPSEVTHIKKSAFYSCEQLREVKFANDSKLQVIEEKAFSSTSISSIEIPPGVRQIGIRAFFWCFYLKRIEIPVDLNLNQLKMNYLLDH